MNKSIEINQSTIIKILLVVVGFAAIIFLLDKYDQNTKSVKLGAYINKMQESNVVKDLAKTLDQINLDSLENSYLPDINSKVQMISNEFNRAYYYNMRILLKNKSGYYIAQKRFDEFVFHESIARTTEDLINNINRPNANISLENTKTNRGANKNRIILPLSNSNKHSSYLEFSYYENH